MTSVVILGGGISGLSLAWHLNKNGFRNFTLFEKEGIPGGLARTEGDAALQLDRCSQPISLREGYSKILLSQLLQDRVVGLERNDWVFLRNTFTKIPIETNLSDIPGEIRKECLLGLIEARQVGAGHPEGSRSVRTFEDWILANYGRGIAAHFLIPFYEKFWTVHPRELTSKWTGWHTSPASLEEVIDGLFKDQPKPPQRRADLYYGIRGGIGSLADVFAAAIPDVRLSAEACEIDLAKKHIRFRDGREQSYDRLFCSLPLHQLGRILKPLPEEIREAFGKLRYTSILNINLALERRVTGMHSIDFPEPGFSFYRLTFPDNFSGASLDGANRISIEVAYSPHKPINRQQVIEAAERDLLTAGLLKSSDRILTRHVFDIEYGRVLPDHRHHDTVAQIREFLEEREVYTFGRYGAWDSSGLEEAITNGKKIADEVIRSEGQGYSPRMPDQSPLVSIVIPVYNEEKYLETYTRQILDAVGKLGIPYELILAENGSRDRTVEIADHLATVHRQVRAVHYPEPNYGKGLALGVLHASGDIVVCFEIDFWDAEFVEISQVLLKKYDAVIGSKQAPGARDRRPWIRRMITYCFNFFLKIAYGFQGTDTHGIKSFRREKGLPIVRDCQTGKDIFATELVLRMQRAGLYMCELPLEIEEKRAPSIKLLKRVPSTIRNLILLWRVTRNLQRVDQRNLEPAPKVSVDP